MKFIKLATFSFFVATMASVSANAGGLVPEVEVVLPNTCYTNMQYAPGQDSTLPGALGTCYYSKINNNGCPATPVIPPNQLVTKAQCDAFAGDCTNNCRPFIAIGRTTGSSTDLQ